MPLFTLQEQYEKFPYPPINRLATPRIHEGKELAYEFGQNLIGNSKTHNEKRILVCGCGTFESLVVAQTHPDAKEVVSIDFSRNSIARLKTRMRLARLARPFRLPKTRFHSKDLKLWSPDTPFDYIIASNVLHHDEDPAQLLRRISTWLKPGGIIRLVTYPNYSRFFMQLTSHYFQLLGLDPYSKNLVKACEKAIHQLPHPHPIRSCYLAQPEKSQLSGLIDAFFNVVENPLSPLEWKTASQSAGLSLIGETQEVNSSSTFLTQLLPETKTLDQWTRLEILDRVFELCSNPIFWFQKTETASKALSDFHTRTHSKITASLQEITKKRPEIVIEKVRENLSASEKLLEPAQINSKTLLKTLKRNTGPRYHPLYREVLPGLTANEWVEI